MRYVFVESNRENRCFFNNLYCTKVKEANNTKNSSNSESGYYKFSFAFLDFV